MERRPIDPDRTAGSNRAATASDAPKGQRPRWQRTVVLLLRVPGGIEAPLLVIALGLLCSAPETRRQTTVRIPGEMVAMTLPLEPVPVTDVTSAPEPPTPPPDRPVPVRPRPSVQPPRIELTTTIPVAPPLEALPPPPPAIRRELSAASLEVPAAAPSTADRATFTPPARRNTGGDSRVALSSLPAHEVAETTGNTLRTRRSDGSDRLEVSTLGSDRPLAGSMAEAAPPVRGFVADRPWDPAALPAASIHTGGGAPTGTPGQETRRRVPGGQPDAWEAAALAPTSPSSIGRTPLTNRRPGRATSRLAPDAVAQLPGAAVHSPATDVSASAGGVRTRRSGTSTQAQDLLERAISATTAWRQVTGVRSEVDTRELASLLDRMLPAVRGFQGRRVLATGTIVERRDDFIFIADPQRKLVTRLNARATSGVTLGIRCQRLEDLAPLTLKEAYTLISEALL